MRLPLLASALLVFTALGCHSEDSIPEPQAPQPTPSAPVSDKAPEPQVKADPNHNPDRMFHLSKLDRGTIQVNGTDVPVWLMNDGEKRQEGMMFLTEKEVKPHEGMLFVFPTEQGADHGFWMSNTILPLDIVYISKDFKVVNAVKGKPFDETNLPAGTPFQYVLELRQGGAEKLKIKKGSFIEIPESLRKST
jgi:uncharacterized membrane protein (UPF0127 family)